MRYLFGDSAPFPPQYDFLAALEAFVANAARAVQLDAEVRAVREAASTINTARESALDSLDSFHLATLRALEPKIIAGSDSLTVEYSKHVTAHAANVLEEIKRTATAATAQEQAKVQAEIARRHAEIRTALAAFLVVLRLPVKDAKVSMHLEDGRNEMTAIVSSTSDVVATFTLTMRDAPAWQAPRRIGEFAKDLDLPVGLRRSWFSKGVQHEMVHIDDWILSGMELAPDEAQIRLRKKIAEKDSVIFDVRRNDEGLSAEVHYPGDAEADALPTPLDASALAHLERLWRALQQGVDEVLPRRERLVSVTMDGGDVCDRDRVTALIAKLIAEVAPIVADIAKRSPNPQELSLKAESDKGRREEIYVKKSDLAAKLDALAPAERKLFAPLAIAPSEKLEAGAAKAEKKPGRESMPDDAAWEAEVDVS